MITMFGIATAFFDIFIDLVESKTQPSAELENALLMMLKSPEFKSDLEILYNVNPSLMGELYKVIKKAQND